MSEQRDRWVRLARDTQEFGVDGLTEAAVLDLAAAVLALAARDELLVEARSWAWGYEHGWFEVNTDAPPTWLTSSIPPSEQPPPPSPQSPPSLRPPAADRPAPGPA